MSSDYNVKLPTFEGPLDLLLHLIKVNELEITEISLSQITSQYLDTLKLLETLDLDVAGDFLVMAASLINIKLRSILPDPEEEIEEEAENEGDDYLSARALMQRLIEYRRFKEAALNLGGMAERRALVFVREVALPTINQAQADPGVRGDLGLLLEAFSRVVKFVSRRNFHDVQSEEYNVDDKIALVRRRLLVESRISIDELFAMCQVKIEMIVTLIALLELCRLKELRISQVDSYGSIVAFPRREGDDGPVDDTAREAEELRRLEAEILANRTGLVDNSPPPLDEEDALLAELFKEAEPAPHASSKTAEGAAAESVKATEVLEAEDEAEAEVEEWTEELEGGARVEEIDFTGNDASVEHPAAGEEDAESRDSDAAQDTPDTCDERIEALEMLDAQALLEAEEKIEAAEALEVEAAERVESPYELEAAAPAREHEAEEADAGVRLASFAKDELDAATLASNEASPPETPPQPEEAPHPEEPVIEPAPAEEPEIEPRPEEEPQPEEPAIEPAPEEEPEEKPEEEPQPEEPAIEPGPEEPLPEEPVIEPEPEEPAPAPEPEPFPAEPVPPLTPGHEPLEVPEHQPAELPETEVRSEAETLLASEALDVEEVQAADEDGATEEDLEDEEPEELEDEAPEAPRPSNVLENWDQFESDEPPVDEWHPGADFKPEFPDPFDEDLDDEDEAPAEDESDPDDEASDAYPWDAAEDVVIEAAEPEEESEIVECAEEEFPAAADLEPAPATVIEAEPLPVTHEVGAESVFHDPVDPSVPAAISETPDPEPVASDFSETATPEIIVVSEPVPAFVSGNDAEPLPETTVEEPEYIAVPDPEPISVPDDPAMDIIELTVKEPEHIAVPDPEPAPASEGFAAALPEPTIDESILAGSVEETIQDVAVDSSHPQSSAEAENDRVTYLDVAPASSSPVSPVGTEDCSPPFQGWDPEADTETSSDPDFLPESDIANDDAITGDLDPGVEIAITNDPAVVVTDDAATEDPVAQASSSPADDISAPDDLAPLLHIARYRVARIRGAGQTARAHKAGAGRTPKAHRGGGGRPGRIRRVKLRQPWTPGGRTTNLFYDLCLARGGDRPAPLDTAFAPLPAVIGSRDLVPAGLDRELRRGMGCGALLLLIFLIAGGTFAVATRSHDKQPAAATLDPPRQDLTTPGKSAAAGPEKQS